MSTVNYNEKKDELIKYFKELEDLLGVEDTLYMIEHAVLESFYPINTVEITLEGDIDGDSEF